MNRIYGLLRENIKALSPYSTARDECKRRMDIYLDANENPFDNGVNRYPSPFQEELKKIISSLRRVPAERIFLGNGSDEAIDLIFRIFCNPGKSSAIVVSPSYGMYSTSAAINDVRIIEAQLESDFNLNGSDVLNKVEDDTKVIFICSPNNPSGNLLDKNEIIKVIEGFGGIVVVDEAYIDFADDMGISCFVDKYQNLMILQTLSKGWGMAGLRLGIAIADEFIIGTMNKVKYPYNISILNQEKGVELLKDSMSTIENIRKIKEGRKYLAKGLSALDAVVKVFPSDANFLLVKFKDKEKVFKVLQENGIIVRDRSSLPICEGCLRITVGTAEENKRVLDVIGSLCDNRESEGFIDDCDKLCRRARVVRNTRETSVQVDINLDHFREPYIRSGINFMDHMLEQIGYHGGFGIDIVCSGDTERGLHHTIEDIGIAIGEALKNALGEKKCIERYGFALPMDESQAMVLIDLGGRIDFKWEANFKENTIEGVESQMFCHFFKSLAHNLKCNLHIKAQGENDHHIIEGIFKAFARAIKSAARKDELSYGVASSKGLL